MVREHLVARLTDLGERAHGAGARIRRRAVRGIHVRCLVLHLVRVACTHQDTVGQCVRPVVAALARRGGLAPLASQVARLRERFPLGVAHARQVPLEVRKLRLDLGRVLPVLLKLGLFARLALLAPALVHLPVDALPDPVSLLVVLLVHRRGKQTALLLRVLEALVVIVLAAFFLRLLAAPRTRRSNGLCRGALTGRPYVGARGEATRTTPQARHVPRWRLHREECELVRLPAHAAQPAVAAS